MPLRLITSAAYVGQELAAEFGTLPPAFLPVGLTRLYELQVAQFAPGALYLTIPEHFKPQPYDLQRLRDLEVTLVPVPEGLKLGDSVIYALNLIAAPHGPVQLLHGDTIVENIPADSESDFFAVQDEGDDYSWAFVSTSEGRVTDVAEAEPGAERMDLPVACGFFSFSDSALLARALTRARGDFVAGLRLYAQERDVTARKVQTWRDFGHVQTYFRSRREVTTARSFNSLRIDSIKVVKSSADDGKMAAEVHWLRQLPPELLPFTARLLQASGGAGRASYETEYQYAPTLSDLLIFSSVGRPTWRKIIRSCGEFLSLCAQAKSDESGDRIVASLSMEKTVARLERYARETGTRVDVPMSLDGAPLPSLLRIGEIVADHIDLGSGRPGNVMHGDFCFSNILFNSRSGRIVVIDPRGYVDAGQPSIYGDTRYDLAKLWHSVMGYDRIMAGRYALRRNGATDFHISFEAGANDEWLQSAVSDLTIDGLQAGARESRAITVTLFLAMLPLHADRPDRQAAFIANALRLFADLDR